MKKQIAIAGLLVGLVIIALGYVKYQQISQAMAEASQQQPLPVSVTSALVLEQNWAKTLDAVGTLQAVRGAMLSAEASGRVAAIGFESGSRVEKGQVLIELDSEVERAELQGAEAKLELSELNAKRQKALQKKRANAQSDLDSALAELQNARAEVKRLKAIIERRRVVAPFGGTVGIVDVDLGQMISVGTPVVALQAFDSLHVDFSVPQQAIARIRTGAQVELSIDAFPERVFVGELTAIDSEIDSVTRNVRLQATLANPKNLLRPGMYAKVTVILVESEKVLSIPSSSISYAPYGNSVYVIAKTQGGNPKTPRAVRAVTVQLGRRLGERVVVTKGLEKGDEVVSSGTFRLRPGAFVIVNNSVMPGASRKPTPSDT